MSDRVVPVGLLTSYIREVLEQDQLLADIWVEGEVSNLFRARSGHTYFTVKDETSQLKCVLFKGSISRQRYLPATGDQIAAHGHISVYEREGAYQLYVDVLQPAGLGVLALQLERLRQQLDAEGLFEEERKRPLPATPHRIGVVTSPDGAVWHDIQNVIGRRFPYVELVLSPATVQGERAPAALIAALMALQHNTTVDVIILARGGGSTEDLWAFNDERLARAIFACRVPVVSAVGHETDWTIADCVADVRAPTPSAAAELVVPDVAEIQAHLAELSRRLRAALRADLADRAEVLGRAAVDLQRYDPRLVIAGQRAQVHDLLARAGRGQQQKVGQARMQLTQAVTAIGALSPRAVLGRGYALLVDPQTHRLVSREADAQPGRPVRAYLVDGDISLRIEPPNAASPQSEREHVVTPA